VNKTDESESGLKLAMLIRKIRTNRIERITAMQPDPAIIERVSEGDGRDTDDLTSKMVPRPVCSLIALIIHHLH
jgi:hypothetical protein